MSELEDKLVKPTIDLEKVFFDIFTELKLKPAQCQLIRAFLVLSNGKNEFEASFTELGNILYKTKGYDKKAYNNARYAVKALNKWQQKHQVKLIELLKVGSRETDVMKNKTEYKKSEYRFAALAKIAEAYSGNATDLQAIVKYTIEELRKDFVPDEPKKKYHPNYSIKIAKKTIYTKLGKIFELALELGEEPYYRCKTILEECSDILNFMDSKYKEHRDRDSFIADFEREYGLSEINEEEYVND